MCFIVISIWKLGVKLVVEVYFLAEELHVVSSLLDAMGSK